MTIKEREKIIADVKSKLNRYTKDQDFYRQHLYDLFDVDKEITTLQHQLDHHTRQLHIQQNRRALVWFGIFLVILVLSIKLI